MANESIRLPSDSTVASQKVHRGNDLPETQLPPVTTKPIVKPTPLLTVVLQAQALVEGKKGQLFELLLQNDPKSEPPIRVIADTQIKPGTSLLLELNNQGQYQPIAKPDAAQLTKLIQLELDFWRSQLIPKAGNSEAQKLPDLKALQALSQLQPALKPLIDWLSQRPSQINGNMVARWFQESTPLQNMRAAAPMPTASNIQLPIAQQTAQARPASIEHPARLPSLAPTLLNQPTLLKTWLGSNVAAPPQPQPPLGQLLPALQSSPLKLIGHVTKALPPLTSPLNGPAIGNEGKPTTELSRAQVSIVSTPSTISPTPANASKAGVVPASASNTMPAQHVSAPSTQLNPGSTASHSSPLPSVHQALLAPHAPVSPGGRLATVPLEIRLSQWVQTIDQMIQKTPTTFNSQLSLQAAELLKQLVNESGPGITNSASPKVKVNPKDEPLLQLRNWLENQQVRMQTMAVQTAANQWQTPDQPTVQQMQLPLIWLGLTGWADIEWWQQPRSSKEGVNKKKRQSRRWRMKIFLNMNPLAPVCADLNWSDEFTRLTFWSEDAGTLSHLNRLLPKLDEWTTGLGERQLQTKYGMPKKAAKQSSQDKQHLVDVRT